MIKPDILEFKKEILTIARTEMSGKNLKDHDFDHVQRVVMYTELLARATGADTCIYDLVAAAGLHDVRRENDLIDPYHGKESAEYIYENVYPKYPFLDVDSIMFAAKHHCDYKTEDGKIPILSNYILPVRLNERIPTVLWDADRLDLARIPKFFGKLDINYFHTDFAKAFANSAAHKLMYHKFGSVQNNTN